MTINAIHVRIYGRVQGVGFRTALREQAQANQVTGWVRNRGDGTVEAQLVGPTEALQRVLAWCEQGPPMATVDGVQVDDLPEIPHYSAFSLF